MNTQFEQYMRSKASFTDDELHRIFACATPLTVRRRQLLLREGEVCHHKLFVLSGLLRLYRQQGDGAESILRFSSENDWAIDHESYVAQTPSHCRIEALEDAEVLLWPRHIMDDLFAAMPTFRLMSDQLKEQRYNESLQRIFINISHTAEEKYDAFATTYPHVLRRVPLHMVASYLGVSRETLSRVRQKHYRVG